MYVAPAIQPPHAHAPTQSSTATVVVMATVAPTRQAPLVASPEDLAGFARWAADRVSRGGGIATAYTPDESAVADEHRPEWSHAYQPTRRQEVEDLGQRIGLEGAWPTFEETFLAASTREVLTLSLEFSEGLHSGHRLRARRIGYEVGVDGGPGDLPATVPGRFSLDFLVGWDAGSAERAERARVMADHFARLDFEAAEDERERELMQLAREAGGWDRLAGRDLI